MAFVLEVMEVKEVPVGAGASLKQGRRRESTGTNAPETMFTSADLRGVDDTGSNLRRVQAVKNEMDASGPEKTYVRETLSRTKAKKSAKSKRKSGGDSDGGDDDSDNSDDKRRKGRSDDSDSEGERRKKGLTRDYLDTIKKSPMLATPREMMATLAETPGAVRRGLLPYYPYATATGPPVYGMMPGTFPSQIVMREKPTIEKLCCPS